MYNLFLDDFRQPEDASKYMLGQAAKDYRLLKWYVVRNYKQFVRHILRHGCPELVSFDHDLCDEHILLGHAKYTDWDKYHEDRGKERERTGYDAAKWLINYCINRQLAFPAFYVHSQNPVGAKNIKDLINNYLKHEIRKDQIP